MTAPLQRQLSLSGIQNRITDGTHECSRGWSARCARSKGPRCKCRCNGYNHGNKDARPGDHEHLDSFPLGPRVRPVAGAAYFGRVDADRRWQAYRGNGTPLDPRLDLMNHSPTGFAWGYGGSGPAQLALAVCADWLRSDGRAMAVYQRVKWSVFSQIPQDENWTLTSEAMNAIFDNIDFLPSGEASEAV